MVLHLLGKKSWNVYNKDNIERVRRDEAAAAAQDEAAEQLMQDEDAARRTAILRGESPPPLVVRPDSAEPSTGKRDCDRKPTHDRKRRRLRGEDDTDAEIRHAREDAAQGASAKAALSQPSEKASASDAAIVDHAGHINLFPAPDERQIRKKADKNAEAEAEKAKKKREYEDQYTMRFSNAAGFKQGLEKPWYAAQLPAKTEQDGVVAVEEPGKNVWGRPDPKAKEREHARASSNDPMAFMKKAQMQLKQAEKDKEAWKEKARLEMVPLEASRSDRLRDRDADRIRRRKERDTSVDSLNGFSLDGTTEKRRHHSHRGSRRSRSPDTGSRHDSHGSRHRHHHRSRRRSPA